jgi:hypothetical protein
MLTRQQVILSIFLVLAAPAFVPGQANRPTEERTDKSGGIDFYQYQLEGTSLDTIRADAKKRALATTVGTLYFEDRYIIAPELLDVYLERRIEDYISGVKVLNIDRGVGVLSCEVQVAVNKKKLERDLEEKRFFYKPKKRPYFHISLAESVDGVAAGTSPAREEVAQTLRELLARPTPFQITVPSPTLDVEANQEVLYQALVAARRQGIELILTGTVEAEKSDTERLYYTDFTYFDSFINLKLIRVQDGEILREVQLTARAGDPDETKAGQLALSRAAGDATRKILENFFSEWRLMSLDEADYRIMVEDVSQEELDAFINRLTSIPPEEEMLIEGVTPEPKVYKKSYVNDVAVLNFVFQGEAKRLRQTIEESRYPRFNIERFDDGDVILTRLD